MDNLLDFSTNVYNIEQYLKVGDGLILLNYKNISINIITKIISTSGFPCKIFSNVDIADHIFNNCCDKTNTYKYVTLACHYASDTAATELFTKYYDKSDCQDICILLGLAYFKNIGYEFYGLRMIDFWQEVLETRYGNDFIQCTQYKCSKKYNYKSSYSNKQCCLTILQEHFDNIIIHDKLSEGNFYLYHIMHIVCGAGNNIMISDAIKCVMDKKIWVCEVPYCPLQHALTNDNLTEDTVNVLRDIMNNCEHNDNCTICAIL